MSRPADQGRRLIPPGLRCITCRRPFSGPLAPTDRAIATDLGLVHAHGCTPMTNTEVRTLAGHTVRCAKIVANLERVEDVEWMDAAGESLTGAAIRLGLDPSSLAKWLQRHHHRDLLERLQGREEELNPWSDPALARRLGRSVA